MSREGCNFLCRQSPSVIISENFFFHSFLESFEKSSIFQNISDFLSMYVATIDVLAIDTHLYEIVVDLYNSFTNTFLSRL